MPPQTVQAQPAAKVTVSPQKVREATDKLLTQSTHALKWLTDRGITSEMIQHYRLGVVRCQVGDSSTPSKKTHLPAISIPIPAAGGTSYYQKKRVRPWEAQENQPDGYMPWSQYGIPQMVYFAHEAETPSQTWLCEGEWDAICLGWAVKNSDLINNVQVACFTCGAGSVPLDSELTRLPGEVIVWYDRDEAGEKGAHKVQARLTERCKVATVPAVGNAPEGWDVSDAIAAGLFEQFTTAAAAARPWEPPKVDNPLRSRLVINDEMVARAPDYTDWLVDDILTADELFLLAASPRAGKSLLALTLTHAVAMGGKFLGRPVSQGAVIYIRCEDSETKTKERQLKQGWGEGLPVYWLDKFKLTELDHLESLIEELDVRLVVFDTLSRIRDASISESSAEMSQLLEPLQEMCKRQRCCGILVHHTGKVSTDNAGTISVFDTIRGSSAIRATCRGVLILAADERSYRLYVENGWGKLDLQVLLDANTLQWRLLGNWIAPNVDLNQKDRVLAFLSQVGRADIDAIAEATNLPKRSLYEVLKRLQSDDMIEKHGSRTQAVYVRANIQQLEMATGLLNEDERTKVKADQPPSTAETQSQQVIQQNCITHVTEPIQQIQQVESVLNRCNEERERFSAPIQQLPESASPPEKVITFEKSDQKNDHFFVEDLPPTPGELLTKSPDSMQGKGYGIQQGFNSESTRLSEKVETWLYCSEIDTAVRLIKQGKERSRCYVPGMGERQFNNTVLSRLEWVDVESGEGEHV